tara:strand:+ start:1322 stop:1603 length:282 start_codon:yes stop_codon:yes gene_type:complete
MQQLLISPRQNSLNTTNTTSASLIQRQTAERADTSQGLSISVLEWLNAELRKEVEKQEIVALRANVNIMDRLQNMLSTNATGITIMVASFFLV